MFQNISFFCQFCFCLYPNLIRCYDIINQSIRNSRCTFQVPKRFSSLLPNAVNFFLYRYLIYNILLLDTIVNISRHLLCNIFTGILLPCSYISFPFKISRIQICFLLTLADGRICLNLFLRGFSYFVHMFISLTL